MGFSSTQRMLCSLTDGCLKGYLSNRAETEREVAVGSIVVDTLQFVNIY